MDEQPGFAGVTAVRDGSDLESGVSVGELYAGDMARHLRHRLIQCSNGLLDERIGAGREIFHQNNRARVLRLLPNSRQDSPQVVPVCEKGCLKSGLYAGCKILRGRAAAHVLHKQQIVAAKTNRNEIDRFVAQQLRHCEICLRSRVAVVERKTRRLPPWEVLGYKLAIFTRHLCLARRRPIQETGAGLPGTRCIHFLFRNQRIQNFRVPDVALDRLRGRG
jgi:hypothetical protein